MPHDDAAARDEITALRLANGEGCARLLRADRPAARCSSNGSAARCTSSRSRSRTAPDPLLRGGARVAPGARVGLPTGADKGRSLAGFITTTWEELGRPCSERAIEHALACAARRIEAHDDERAVLVHGDVHQWNALEAEDGFKLVDPDGLLAEAEYDLGILMREDPLEPCDGDPHERARWLARRCGLDATAIWEWGVIERVSTGLLCTKVGLQPGGPPDARRGRPRRRVVRAYPGWAAITALAIAVSDRGTSRASWRLRIGPASTLRSNVFR